MTNILQDIEKQQMIGIFLSNVFQTAEKLGISQQQILEIIKKIGYGYVEADWNQIRKRPSDFFELMSELQLKISLYVFINTDCLIENDHHIADDIERISQLGISKLMLVWNSTNDETKEESEKKILLNSKNIFREADRVGVQILAEDFDSLTLPCASTKDLIRYHNNLPGLGFTFDTRNFLIHSEDIYESFELMKNNIKHVHIKDRSSETEHSQAVDPGTGKLPIKEIIHKLFDNKYDGWITAELPYGKASIDIYKETYDLIKDSFC